MQRRDILLGGLGLGTALALSQTGAGPAQAEENKIVYGFEADELGLKPGTEDSTQALQEALNKASELKANLYIAAGEYKVSGIKIPSNITIYGNEGATVFKGNAPIFFSEKAENITIFGCVFEDISESPGDKSEQFCVSFKETHNLYFNYNTIRHTKPVSGGLRIENCKGQIAGNKITSCGLTAIFSQNAKGLEIINNHISDCANNGIQVWRDAPGEDGTIVTHNRIERIKAVAGGEGQNGNGINLFKADNVIVSNNRISDCAFTAIRANASSNCQILGNNCSRLGEVAIYAEFKFLGSIIANNIIDEAASGISVTNFKEGGRLAVIQGNLIRNLKKRGSERGIGISAEADTMISGNVIENADVAGMMLGWGQYLRDVSAMSNVIRNCNIGIAISANAKAGFATVTGNMITGSKDGAIRAMDMEKFVGPDLSQKSAESFRNFAVYANVAL